MPEIVTTSASAENLVHVQGRAGPRIRTCRDLYRVFTLCKVSIFKSLGQDILYGASQLL